MEEKNPRKAILEFPCDVERLENGNTLIADAGAEDGSGSEIIEVDSQGKVVWNYSQGLAFAHSAKRLENGNTLIADTTNNRVIEVTSDDQMVFSTDDLDGGTGKLSDGTRLSYPNDAHAMDDGSIFVTDRNNNRFVNFYRQGNIIRSYTGELRHPHNCDPLENGNVIVANSDDNSIVEIGSNKDIVWQYKDENNPLSWPRDADRLENGNTLITDSKNKRVFEIDSNGKVIWEFKVDYFSNFYDADRLTNGNTLISDQQHHQVIEVNPQGEIVWKFRNYAPLLPLNERLTNTSFKKVTEDKTPESWILARRLSEGGGKIIWTENERGKMCPGLEYDRNGALCLQQNIKVEAQMVYNISAKLKTENVEGIACVQFAFLDEMGGLIQDVVTAPKGNLFSGTTDWTLDSFVAEAPENATAAEVRLFINSPGKVWANNINVFC